MARSHGVLKTEVWEPGSELRRRTLHAQWAYVMLISQPQINNCGIVPYVPEKWVRYAANLNPDTLHQAIDELQQHRFVIVDQDTGELLIRTFIKHDRIWRQPNLIKSARKQWHEIESDQLREILVTLHPWLDDDRPTRSVTVWEEQRPSEPLPEPLPEPLFEGLPEPLPGEPLPEGVNARTRVPATRTTPSPTPEREPPRLSLSALSNGARATTTPPEAPSSRPARAIAEDYIRNVGAEIPTNDLRASLATLLTTNDGRHRFFELTPDDLTELADLHADVARLAHARGGAPKEDAEES
jgi:hypothetical protein